MNLTSYKDKLNELNQKAIVAMQTKDAAKFVEIQSEINEVIMQQVRDEFKANEHVEDSRILVQRGVRQLTSEENHYYELLIEAMRNPKETVKQAVSNLDVVLPETVYNDIFKDLQQNHELLSMLDFEVQNVKSKFFNDSSDDTQKAVWGELGTAITQEVTAALSMDELGMGKLTAYFLMPNDFLDLGPQWLDRYIRLKLYNYLSNGLEDGYINNLVVKNDNAPIGMKADLDAGSTASGTTTYTAKTATAITEFTPSSLGTLLGQLAKDAKGNPRKIENLGLMLIVNPFDYFTKVFPATTIMAPDGTYRNNVLPYPIKIVQSIYVAQNSAILGLGKRYFAPIGMGNKGGKIEYSDEYKFLEDVATYKIKLYGNGKPMDNNSFIPLDITNLAPLVLKVKQVS